MSKLIAAASLPENPFLFNNYVAILFIYSLKYNVSCKHRFGEKRSKCYFRHFQRVSTLPINILIKTAAAMLFFLRRRSTQRVTQRLSYYLSLETRVYFPHRPNKT